MVGSGKVTLLHQRAGESDRAGIIGSTIGRSGVVSRFASYVGAGIRKRRAGGSVPISVETGAKEEREVFNRLGDEDSAADGDGVSRAYR